MSDGSQFAGTLTSSDTSGFFAISGLNIVTARALTSADDGTHSTTITASQGGQSRFHGVLNMIKTLFFDSAPARAGPCICRQPERSVLGPSCRPAKRHTLRHRPALYRHDPCRRDAGRLYALRRQLRLTQTQSFTDIRGTHQWSNLSSWLNCSNSNATPYLLKFVGTVACNTAHITVGPDPGHGNVQALIMSYYKTDKDAGNFSNTIQTLSPSSAAIAGNAMPEEYYIEQVLRPNATTCSSTGSVSFGI